MPKNKQQLERFEKIIDLLNLRKGVFVTVDEMMSRCDVQRSTLMEDISLLRNPPYNAPISYNKKEKGYFLLESYQMPHKGIGVSREDIQQLKFLVLTLKQLRHLSIFKNLEGLIQKFENSVKYQLDKDGRNSDKIFFEPIPFYQGTEHLSLFFKAIETTHKITFDYQTFKSETTNRHIIEPYFLQEHSNRWYIVGRLLPYDSITSFALERIIGEPEILKDYFEMPKDFTAEKYFKNVFGITNDYNTPIEEIHLQFDSIQAKYFISKPFHDYEKIEHTENYLIVKMNLKINYELIRKLAGMGNSVKVLQPQTLVKTIQEFFVKALEQY